MQSINKSINQNETIQSKTKEGRFKSKIKNTIYNILETIDSDREKSIEGGAILRKYSLDNSIVFKLFVKPITWINPCLNYHTLILNWEEFIITSVNKEKKYVNLVSAVNGLFQLKIDDNFNLIKFKLYDKIIKSRKLCWLLERTAYITNIDEEEKKVNLILEGLIPWTFKYIWWYKLKEDGKDLLTFSLWDRIAYVEDINEKKKKALLKTDDGKRLWWYLLYREDYAKKYNLEKKGDFMAREIQGKIAYVEEIDEENGEIIFKTDNGKTLRQKIN